MGFVSPDSVADPSSDWNNDANSIDGNQASYASMSIPAQTWSGYLEFTIGEISCDKIRFDNLYSSPNIISIDIDVYYDGAWNDVYEGVYSSHVWVEKSIPAGTKNVTVGRIRVWNNNASLAKISKFYEFQFNEVAPLGIKALFMDLSTQLWAIKHSIGIFTKL